MRGVPAVDPRLDDATAKPPEAKRTSRTKAEIASHILACAAKGERDPVVLKMAALSAGVECTHYSHEFCTENVRYAESNGLSANAPPLLSLTQLGHGVLWSNPASFNRCWGRNSSLEGDTALR